MEFVNYRIAIQQGALIKKYAILLIQFSMIKKAPYAPTKIVCTLKLNIQGFI